MKYDAIVIGSGQGGNPLVYALAERGWSVALVEKSQLGGTCINTGCTPTKTMIASAQVAYYARNAARWGVKADNIRVDLPAVVARKNAVVQRFRGGHEKRIPAHKSLRLYRAHAKFTGPHTIQVDGEMLESEKIFIDTGTRPDCPGIDGLQSAGYLTNESIMELQEVPEHLIILGGGYIGLEFGQMFRRFGSRVTIIHIGNQLLAREDADVAQGLQKALESEGVEFYLNAKSTRVARQATQVSVSISTGQQNHTIAGTHLLCATGRRPNTGDLGLDKAGVALDPRGYVKVNGRMETSAPGSWALGDVKGGPAVTPLGQYHRGEISQHRESLHPLFAFHRSTARPRRHN